jgi:signal transduction histidine kinase
MHPELTITNIGLGISFLVAIILSAIVLTRRVKGDKISIVFALFNLSGALWMLSYGIGLNLADPHLSRISFVVAVLSVLFLLIFNLHLIVLMTNRLHSQKNVLAVMYTIAIAGSIFYAIFPDTLLLPSEPKLYFVNYFVPGSLYQLQDYFFFFCLLYLLGFVLYAYHYAEHRLRNRIRYFVIALVYGYGLGLLPALVLYDLPIDPLPACLIGFYNVFMAYAIFKYDLVDLNILSKRAFGYGLSVVAITIFILAIGYTNDTLIQLIPGFPQWLLPFISSCAAVGVGLFVWKKVKEVDVLKYQFVDVVTHKFRTPLTYIKWSVDALRRGGDPAEQQKALSAIDEAHTRLIGLTDLLAGIPNSDDSQFTYVYGAEDLGKLADEVSALVHSQLEEKKLTIEKNIPADFPKVHIDRNKFFFALQMVVENALIYSPEGSKIVISVSRKNENAILSVRDFGIGISKEDLPRLFSKFFRAKNATSTHTEGLGIGLFLSRDILHRQGGDLWAESQGHGTGATFFFKIPIER